MSGSLRGDLLLAVLDLAVEEHVGVHERRAPQHARCRRARSIPLEVEHQKTSGSQTTTDTMPSSFITRILSTLRFGGLPASTSLLRDLLAVALRREASSRRR